MAKAKHSVNVLIKAKDHASKIFGIVGTSAKAMGRALKSAASITRKAFTKAFQIARRAVMGLAAAFAYATYAAIKQENAELELKGVLIGLGVYSKEVMEDFKQFASAMQEATTWGDEYVLSLLKVAAAQTDSSKAAKELVSDTLALINIVPAGKMKPLAFMKMVLGYKKGLKDLDTYLLALKGVTDEVERQRIYTEALAAAWGLWEEKIKSTQGAFIRTWNAIGDAAEKIGEPFLADMRNSAEAIKKWAEDNKATIAWWAEKTHSAVTLAKDVFMEFVELLKTDWRAGLNVAIDGAVVSFRILGRSITEIMARTFKTIGANIKHWIILGLAKKMGSAAAIHLMAQEAMEAAGYKVPSVVGMPGGAPQLKTYATEHPKAWKKAVEESGRKVEELYGDNYDPITEPIKHYYRGLNRALKDIIEEETANFVEGLPSEFRSGAVEAWAEYKRRSKEIGAAPGPGGPAGPAEPAGYERKAADALKDMAGKTVRGLPAREARFLTFAPGTKFDYTQQTAKNTNKMTTILMKIERGIGKMVRKQEKTTQQIGTFGYQVQVSNFP